MAAHWGFFLCSLLCCLCVSYAGRKVTTNFINPPICNGTCVFNNGIAHVEAVGDSDTLHYLITSIGVPTVLVLHTNTEKDPGLTVNWAKWPKAGQSKSNSVYFNNAKVKVHYSYAVLFTRLLEYNDTTDDADMTKYTFNSTLWNVYDFAESNFTWFNVTTQSDKASNMITLTADNTTKEFWLGNGSISLQFQAHDHTDRQDHLPHLQYHENLTVFDLTIDGVATDLKASRFALEVIVVSDSKEGMHVDHSRSIDDEYTPGIFKIYNWLTKPEQQDITGFFQWKPVCYLDKPRARAVATSMREYDLNTVDQHKQMLLNGSIAYAFYGENIMETMTRTTNFSFGLSKDGGYAKKKYTAWSGSIGYGPPPKDKVSLLVIAVISVGLGLPVIIIIIGGIGVFVKKRRDKSRSLIDVTTDYQPISS